MARVQPRSGQEGPPHGSRPGIDINRAARISSAAHGGQILVSDSTLSLAERSLPEGVEFRDLGEHRLKGIDKPERVYQLLVEGLSNDFPPLRTDAIGVAHIPGRLTSFVRRPTETATLGQLLDDARLITLIGPGGTGKTSLAAEIGRLLAPDFADGAWFVDLAPIKSPDLVGSAIFGTLGLATKSQRSIAELLVEHLESRHLLLIIDNFEHLLPAADLIADLTSQCPRLTVLVTSRTSLNLYGEQEFSRATPRTPYTGRRDGPRFARPPRSVVPDDQVKPFINSKRFI